MKGRSWRSGGRVAGRLIGGGRARWRLYAGAVAWTGGFDLRDRRAAAALARLGAAARPRADRVRRGGVDRPPPRRRRGRVGVVVRSIARRPPVPSRWWRSPGRLTAAAVFSTLAVGGADSYGYAGQARLLAQGRLTDSVPLSPAFTWPDAETTLRPLGFTQGPHARRDRAGLSAGAAAAACAADVARRALHLPRSCRCAACF